MKNVRKIELQCEGRANKERGIGAKTRPTFTQVGINHGVDWGILKRTPREACSAGRLIQCQGSKGSTGHRIQEFGLLSSVRQHSTGRWVSAGPDREESKGRLVGQPSSLTNHPRLESTDCLHHRTLPHRTWYWIAHVAGFYTTITDSWQTGR